MNGLTNKTIHFLDAVKMHEENPETFQIPSQEEIDSITIGDHVKVCIWDEHNQPERMWVEVILIAEKHIYFQGLLDNVPIGLEHVKYRDSLLFGPENILDVMKSF